MTREVVFFSLGMIGVCALAALAISMVRKDRRTGTILMDILVVFRLHRDQHPIAFRCVHWLRIIVLTCLIGFGAWLVTVTTLLRY